MDRGVRVRINKKHWNQFLQGGDQKSLQDIPVLAGNPHHRLFSVELYHSPGAGRNTLILTGSHSKEKILRHLLLRHLLEIPTESERSLFTILGAISSDWWFHLTEFIHQNEILLRTTRSTRAFLSGLQFFKRFSMENPQRFLGSFSPRILIFRFWKSPRKKVTLPATMGVGYKDHGSLRSGTPIEIGSTLEEVGSLSRELEEFLEFLEFSSLHLHSSSTSERWQPRVQSI